LKTLDEKLLEEKMLATFSKMLGGKNVATFLIMLDEKCCQHF
jgi:hypothetical protein